VFIQKLLHANLRGRVLRKKQEVVVYCKSTKGKSLFRVPVYVPVQPEQALYLLNPLNS